MSYTFKGMGASASLPATSFAAKFGARVAQANAKMAQAIAPAAGVVRRLPARRGSTWRSVILSRPLDGITSLFAPMQGLVTRIVERAVALMPAPKKLQVGGITYDVALHPFGMLPPNARKWAKRMEVNNTFMILAAFAPQVLVRAMLDTRGLLGAARMMRVLLRTGPAGANLVRAMGAAMGLPRLPGLPPPGQVLSNAAAEADRLRREAEQRARAEADRLANQAKSTATNVGSKVKSFFSGFGDAAVEESYDPGTPVDLTGTDSTTSDTTPPPDAPPQEGGDAEGQGGRDDETGSGAGAGAVLAALLSPEVILTLVDLGKLGAATGGSAVKEVPGPDGANVNTAAGQDVTAGDVPGGQLDFAAAGMLEQRAASDNTLLYVVGAAAAVGAAVMLLKKSR